MRHFNHLFTFLIITHLKRHLLFLCAPQRPVQQQHRLSEHGHLQGPVRSEPTVSHLHCCENNHILFNRSQIKSPPTPPPPSQKPIREHVLFIGSRDLRQLGVSEGAVSMQNL